MSLLQSSRHLTKMVSVRCGNVPFNLSLPPPLSLFYSPQNPLRTDNDMPSLLIELHLLIFGLLDYQTLSRAMCLPSLSVGQQ
jgi:hypothetical protein